MKKILFTIALAVAAMNINAQLVVDSVGHVGINREYLGQGNITLKAKNLL